MVLEVLEVVLEYVRVRQTQMRVFIYSLNSLSVRVPHNLSSTGISIPALGLVARCWVPGCPGARIGFTGARSIKPMLF